MHIEGVSALVTGGASGLGFATARRLIDLGHTVKCVRNVTDRRRRRRSASSGIARFVGADITDEEPCPALDAAERTGLRVVHCAGRGR
jgi:NAD(P)-dependent dehydrogenase (short-subunit alcohol dehydrogenase family)